MDGKLNLTRYSSINVMYLGFIPTHKYATWMNRQNEKYKESLRVMRKIYSKIPVAEIIKSYKPYVNTTLNVIASIAIKCGTLKYAVHHECDQEIAQFAAQQWRVLAVFSDDSDFLIFGGRWRYFSMKHLNPHTLQTKEYNRQALRTQLNLTDYQLSIWATCLGNDVIHYSNAKHFYRKFKNKFEGIAELIRNKISIKSHDEILAFLGVNLLGFRDNYSNKIINASINSYSVQQEEKPEDPYDYLLKDHKLFTRNVLSNAPFNFSLIFYDLEIYSMPSYFDIAIPMFQRQAGIVFAQANVEGFNLNVYCKQLSSTNYGIHSIPPVLPPFEVHSMEDIHSDDESFDDHRFKLLAWSICWQKLHNFNLRQIPPRYMIDILTLVFLVQSQIITAKEADIFLLSIKNVEQGKVEINTKSLKTLDSRAFHIAFLYTRTYTNVARSIEVCGLNKLYGVS